MHNKYRGCKYITYKGSTYNPLILLHGYSFKSSIWSDVGLLNELERRELSYLAIDMPYGKVSECENKSRDLDYNINLVKELLDKEFNGSDPIILGASLGGFIALQYGVRYPLLGLILIAPVRTNIPIIMKHYSESNIPILLIYGDGDTIVTLSEMERFQRETKNTKLVIYKGARHPAYIKYPDRFSREVAEYVENIVKHQRRYI